MRRGPFERQILKIKFLILFLFFVFVEVIYYLTLNIYDVLNCEKNSDNVFAINLIICLYIILYSSIIHNNNDD